MVNCRVTDCRSQYETQKKCDQKVALMREEYKTPDLPEEEGEHFKSETILTIFYIEGNLADLPCDKLSQL